MTLANHPRKTLKQTPLRHIMVEGAVGYCGDCVHEIGWSVHSVFVRNFSCPYCTHAYRRQEILDGKFDDKSPMQIAFTPLTREYPLEETTLKHLCVLLQRDGFVRGEDE